MKRILNHILISALMLGFGSGCGKKSFDLPPANQEFVQGSTYNTKVDIVLMIDNSSSMGVHQNKLANDIPQMINALNDSGLDWHIGITSTDMNGDGNGDGGELLGEPVYVTAKTENAVQVLQNKIKLGEFGSNNERGLDSLKATLNLQDLNSYATGFWRDDALLAIIFLTDENDHSVITPDQFVAFMDSVKRPFPSGARSWIANLIGTLQLSSQCSANGFPTVAELFKQIVTVSGGVQESICNSSLAQAVQNVKIRMLEFIRDFRLERKPILDSIRVYVNGQLIPQSLSEGWEYIQQGQIIRFHGSKVPGGNDKIKIDYDPAEAT